MAEQRSKDKAERVEKLDEAFKRHVHSAEQAKLEYDEAYERLFANISGSHLEPMAKILLERDGIALDTEVTIKSMQENMRKLILKDWDAAWESHIGGNIAKLEMLKEHFKEFEGKNWMMHDKSVEERTQPLRMEFKLKRLHWLRKQTELQKQKIEKLQEDTVQRRLLIQRTTEEAIKLGERIENSKLMAESRNACSLSSEILNYPNKGGNDEKDPKGGDDEKDPKGGYDDKSPTN